MLYHIFCDLIMVIEVKKVCACVCVCVCLLGTAACNTLGFGTACDTSILANGISNI